MEEFMYCPKCGYFHYKDTADYWCIYRTGYCGDCLIEMLGMEDIGKNENKT